ncbi:MAG: 16S rRNA pseudouridine516 synthase [Oceanicoccus sp.]|jgi:16S rRNA pseudouridine516 synthase
MRLDRFINNKTKLGQKTVRKLLASQSVKADDEVVTDGRHTINQFTKIELNDSLIQEQKAYYLMLHKPTGYVSATTDSQHETVLDLIHETYKGLLHIGGRLDFNTTGLLLLTNDGLWSRKITEPSEKKPKTYLVTTAEEITVKYTDQFREGIYFARENMTTHPAQLEIVEARRARLTIYEGRYHQVKRMFGHFNNKVISLHRESMGPICLDLELLPGGYRQLTDHEIKSIN